MKYESASNIAWSSFLPRFVLFYLVPVAAILWAVIAASAQRGF